MAKASKEIIQQHEQMFYPTVRVRTKKAGGSGTVVYSESYKDEVYTYIITNQHVIDDSVHIEKRWDPVLKTSQGTRPWLHRCRRVRGCQACSRRS